MDKEKINTKELTRKQKLARRFVPLALVAGGAAAFGIHHAQNNKHQANNEYKKEVASVTLEQTAEFQGSKDDWGHGTAENIIRISLGKGVPEALASVGGEPIDADEVTSIVEQLPVHEEADKALELADYAEIAPDEGDRLTIELKITATADNDVSYEVVDAHITDLPNNQN